MTIMKVQEISKDYGGLRALDRVTFSIRRGIVKSIVGPNGAGKTTLLNILSGILRPTEGEIFFDGNKVVKVPAHRRCELGIGRVYQLTKLFKDQSVLDNVKIGFHCRTKCNMFSVGFNFPSAKREEKKLTEMALELLEIGGLSSQASQLAGTLPLGEQRLLEMVRALATQAKLLLLDEPACGLSSAELSKVVWILRNLRERGVTVLLVEHNMNLVGEISDEVLVLNFGKRIAEGSPKDIQTDESVINAFLGRT